MTRRRVLAGALALLAGGVGCGYRLAGSGTNVPASARTISIALFANKSRERGLEVELQHAIEQEFRRRGTLEVVPDPQGDLVLSGSIRRFTTTPVAFSATSEAVQFQGYLLISLKLTERATGRVLFHNRDLAESSDFGAVSGVVVSASPRFQDDTINQRDLLSMTNVQIGETRRRTALRELVGLVAHDVYLQAVEAF